MLILKLENNGVVLFDDERLLGKIVRVRPKDFNSEMTIGLDFGPSIKTTREQALFAGRDSADEKRQK